MICCKAAIAAMAMILLAGSIAEARPRPLAGSEHIALIRPGHPPATIESPLTGEILYRIPRRFIVGGRPPRYLKRSLMLHPVWVPRPAPPIRVQYSGYGPVVMQPPDVVRELGRQGYRDVGGLTRRGSNYVGEATGPQGQRQRLIIDPQSGRVRGSSPSGGGRGPGGGGFYGGY